MASMISPTKIPGLVLAFSLCVTATVFAHGSQEPHAAPSGAPTPHAAFSWRSFSGTTIHLMLDSHPWQKFIQPRINEFEASTGMHVETQAYPEDQFRTKRTVEMVSGTSDIDVFMIMPAEALAQYVHSGWLAPLDPYLKMTADGSSDYDVSDFFSAALDAGVSGGRNYTVPIQVETSLLAYNRDILSRYHVPVPRNMDELLAAARTIYEGSHGQIYGITLRGEKVAATSQWIDFVHSFGGSWLDSDGKSALASPAVIAATELYGKLLRLYGPRDAATNSWYQSISSFMQGRSAMIYDANVFKSYYENPKISKVADRVGYAIIPRGPAGSIPHVSTWSLAINAASPRKDAAWLFIQWATSKQMDLRALNDGIPVARHSSWDSPAFIRNEGDRGWAEATLASYLVASPHWEPPAVPISQSREVVGAAIVESILGGDVPDALTRAAAQMNELLKESR